MVQSLEFPCPVITTFKMPMLCNITAIKALFTATRVKKEYFLYAFQVFLQKYIDLLFDLLVKALQEGVPKDTNFFSVFA